MVVRTRDELFRRAARESLIALQGELLGCMRQASDDEYWSSPHDQRSENRDIPSSSLAGILACWSNGPVRRMKSVLSARVLTQCACSESVRMSLPCADESVLVSTATIRVHEYESRELGAST